MKKEMDPDVIRTLYYDKKKSGSDVAKELGVSASTVYAAMERHGLKRRSRSEAQQLRVEKGSDTVEASGDTDHFAILLGESGRETVLDPYDRTSRYDIPIRPMETTRRAGHRITYKTMARMTESQAICELIESSPEVASIVRTYINYVVQDFKLDGHDDAKRIIEDFISKMGGRAKFLSFLKQVAYGYYVEGAVCIELSNDPITKMAKTMDYVAPWSMGAEKAEAPDGSGEYYRYGQLRRSGKLDPVLYDPHDPEINDDYFKYVPAEQRGNYPFGKSQIGSNIFSATALTNLITLIVQFIQGRVFPKHVFSVDYSKLPDSYSADQITKAAKTVSAMIKGQLDASDISQDLVTSLPIFAVLIGAMERANIDGVELMSDIFERQIQRGSGVPRTLFGSRRTGSGLNDNESRVEWGGWAIAIQSGQVMIELPVSELFQVVLDQRGSRETCTLRLINNDVEINRINAEYFDMKVEAFTKIKDLGLHKRKYLFRKFNDNSIASFDFSDATEEEDFEEMDIPTPQPTGDDDG